MRKCAKEFAEWVVRSTDTHFNRWLTVVIVSAHGYAMCVFGATFWVDSIGYIEMAETLTSVQNLREYYNVTHSFLFSHYMPGLPAVWLAMQLLPVSMQWPVLALLQHGIAAMALYYAFVTVNRYWPSRLHLVVCGILCLLPFYQSFHNMLMTESMNASFVLIATAASLDLLLGGRFRSRPFIILVVALLVGSQFRAQTALLIVGLGLVALLGVRHLLSRWAVVLVVAAVFGYGAFPLYRSAVLGYVLTPGTSLTPLYYVTEVNPHPSKDLAGRMSKVASFPEDLGPEKLLAEGVRDNVFQLMRHWQAQGMSYREIAATGNRIAWLIRTDTWQVMLHCVVCGVTGSGFPLVSRLGPSDHEVFRGITMRQWLYGVVTHYRWLSWVEKSSYRDDFEKIVVRKFPKSGQALAGALDPYFSSIGVRWRDPLYLGRLLPDVWFLIGMVSACCLLGKCRRVGILFLWPILCNVATLASVPLGNPRYSYVLVPLFFLAAASCIGMFTNAGEKKAGMSETRGFLTD